MKKADMDLHTDYLLNTFGAAAATGLSAMVEGEVSHDQITLFLSAQEYSSRDLWLQGKPTVRWVEREEGVMIFEDTNENTRFDRQIVEHLTVTDVDAGGMLPRRSSR
jgi:hypothetical protein